MLLTLWRVLKFALANFRRNLWLSVATVSVMVMAIGMYHLVVTLRVVTQASLTALERKIDVSVYLSPSVSAQSAATLATRLDALPTIDSVEIISPDKALEAFKARRGSDESIRQALIEVGENPFGSTLKIRAKEVRDYPKIIAALEDPTLFSPGIIERKSFSEHQELIKRFTELSAKAQRAIAILAVIFLFISFFVVLNTVRIAIYTHREEIGIMKLVGASNWFVRAPFLIEGALYSVAATLVASGMLAGALFWGGPWLHRFFAGVPVNLVQFYQGNVFMVFGAQFLGLTIINVLGAAVAIRRYLKV